MIFNGSSTQMNYTLSVHMHAIYRLAAKRVHS